MEDMIRVLQQKLFQLKLIEDRNKTDETQKLDETHREESVAGASGDHTDREGKGCSSCTLQKKDSSPKKKKHVRFLLPSTSGNQERRLQKHHGAIKKIPKVASDQKPKGILKTKHDTSKLKSPCSKGQEPQVLSPYEQCMMMQFPPEFYPIAPPNSPSSFERRFKQISLTELQLQTITETDDSLSDD